MAVGRRYEMVRKGRANPLWPPVGPDRGVETQEVTKKPASRARARVLASRNSRKLWTQRREAVQVAVWVVNS